MMTPEAIEKDLAQYHGTETWWKQDVLPGIVYTDGVKRMLALCKAYWLLLEIGMNYTKKEEFQVWILTKHPNESALLSMGDGNGNCFFHKTIPFTDFPLKEIKLFLTDGVLMLPCEY